MRIVLDTNVLVSGLLSATGPPGWIIEAAITGDVDLVFDMAVRQEYGEVLHRHELGLPSARVDDLLAAIDEFAFEVVAAPPWSVDLPDPDDAPFLAVAAGDRKHAGHRQPSARSGPVPPGCHRPDARQFVDYLSADLR